jgi:hypothetical protein
MKQYRITSQNFVHQGETGVTDAVMNPQDLRELKRLAGISDLLEADAGGGGIAATPHASEEGITSPLGSNISATATERDELMKQYAVQPGTDLWFIINFTKPHLTGSLKSHVEKYLKQHPEYRPKYRAGEDPND